jgi:nucleoid-associated protein EbfC
MPGPFGGGMPNLGKLMKEAQQMGEKMKQIEAELAETEVEASSGGGMVKVVTTAAGEVRSIKIQPEAVDPDDVEMLEDLVLTALNEALQNGQALREERLGGVMPGGMNIPGLPF